MIVEEKHRYTMKCFEEFGMIRMTPGYLELTVLVGVWAVAYRLAWPG
jgi:hypothetical protein